MLPTILAVARITFLRIRRQKLFTILLLNSYLLITLIYFALAYDYLASPITESYGVTEAILHPLIAWQTILLLLFSPIISSGLVSEEYSYNTYIYYQNINYPLSTLWLGKYLGAVISAILFFTPTWLYVTLTAITSHLDYPHLTLSLVMPVLAIASSVALSMLSSKFIPQAPLSALVTILLILLSALAEWFGFGHNGSFIFHLKMALNGILYPASWCYFALIISLSLNIISKKHFSLSVVLALLLVGNTYYPWYKDLTNNRLNSLDKNTSQLINNLTHPISIEIYSNNSNSKEYIAALLTPFKLIDKFKISYHGQTAEEEHLVLRYQQQQKIISIANITNLSNILAPLSQLLNQQEKRILISTGHNEELAIDNFLATLQEHGNKVALFPLNSFTSLPNDIALIILIAPQGELLASEEQLLSHYIAQGGKVLYFANKTSSIPEAIRFFKLQPGNSPLIYRNYFFPEGNNLELIGHGKMILAKEGHTLIARHGNIVTIADPLVVDNNFRKLENANLVVNTCHQLLGLRYIFNTQVHKACDLELNMGIEYLPWLRLIFLLLPVILISLHPHSRLTMREYINKVLNRYVRI